MASRSFYLVTGATRGRLLAIRERDAEIHGLRTQFAKKWGATGNWINGAAIVGLVFPTKPSGETTLPHPWKFKGEMAVPDKRIKEGKAIAKEMEAMRVADHWEISNVVGMNKIILGRFITASFAYWPKADVVVMGCDSRQEPNGDCARISDLDYEKGLAEEKRRCKEGAAK